MKGLFAYNRLDEGERQHRPCYVVRQTENDVAQTTHKIPLTKTLSKQHNLYLQKTHYPGENVYEFPVSENEVSNVYHFIKNRYARRNVWLSETYTETAVALNMSITRFTASKN